MYYELKLIREKVSDEDAKSINGAQDVVDYLRKVRVLAADEFWREQLWLIALDNSNAPIGHFLLSAGGTTKTVIDRNLVVRVAVMAGAISVVLVHNHPSGNSLPSVADINQTSELKRTLSPFDIKLLDHVILSEEEYFSFSDEKVSRHKLF